jgi:serine/threonine protein kinase/tetratricopeptide (TPR) repeat protein
LIPIEVGPFRLIRPVARGGMGEVWRAEHTSAGVTVAIKVITAERARAAYYLEALHNEVRAMARLDHPGIVLVLDHGLVDRAASHASNGRLLVDSPYLVMEWVSSKTLKSMPAIRSYDELRRLLLAILGALAHAHARRVVHRDIKPSNVLVRKRQGASEYKLSDFGVAYALGAEADRERVVFAGTPAYMAPEQIAEGIRDQGPWTDLYALGCLAYWAICGRTIYAGTPDEVYRSHLLAPIPALEPRFAVPAGLAQWMRAMLSKRTTTRFRSAADAAHALLELGDAPPGATPEPLPAFEPDGPTAVDVGRPRESFPTIDAADIRDDETRSSTPQDAAAARDSGEVPPPRPRPPPMPEDWRVEEGPSRSMRLVGAGLGLYGLRPVPIAGREHERDALWDALAAVHRERAARAIVLVGPAGNGKTRLGEWLGERAVEVGAARVLAATASPTLGPGEAIADLYRAHFRAGASDGQGSRARARLERALVELSPELGSTAAAIAELITATARSSLAPRTREERFALLRSPLYALATERPVVVRVDDAEWDAEALEFLSACLELERPLPMLAVVALRDDVVSSRPEAQNALTKLLEHPRCRTLPIGPLSPADHAALVESLLVLDANVRAQLVERTQGNALFAVQLVGDWVERGILVPGREGFVVRPGSTLDLPDDLYDLWSTRTNGLVTSASAADRPRVERALEIAAVIGTRVPFPEWETALARASSSVPPGLVQTLAAQRLVLADEEGFSFVHGMLRESFERRAKEHGRLADHHRACAAMLEELYGGEGAHAERVGLHLLAAGDLERCLEPLLRGAVFRESRGEFPRARALLDTRDGALDKLGPAATDRERAKGAVIRAGMAIRRGTLADAAQELARAEALVGDAGDPQLRADIGRHRGGLLLKRGDPAALGEFEKALAAYGELGTLDGLADCHHGIGEVLKFRGHLAEARVSFERSVALAEDARDQSRVARSLGSLGDTVARLGNHREALELIERSVHALEATGLRHSLAIGYNEMGDVARHLGDLALAERHYEHSLAILSELGSNDALIVELNLALTYLGRHDYRRAEPVLLRGGARLTNEGQHGFLAFVHAALMACVAARGDLGRFDEHRGRLTRCLTDFAVVDRDLASTLELAGDKVLAAGSSERAIATYRDSLAQWRRLGETSGADAVRRKLEALGAEVEP